jgi:acyl carrier protein
MDMQTKLLAIVNRMLEAKELPLLASLREDMSLRDDLGFDSLDLAEFTVYVEKEFGVDIFEEGIVNTIREVMDQITHGNR